MYLILLMIYVHFYVDYYHQIKELVSFLKHYPQMVMPFCYFLFDMISKLLELGVIIYYLNSLKRQNEIERYTDGNVSDFVLQIILTIIIFLILNNLPGYFHIQYTIRTLMEAEGVLRILFYSVFMVRIGVDLYWRLPVNGIN